jgi:hypothetical protein
MVVANIVSLPCAPKLGVGDKPKHGRPPLSHCASTKTVFLSPYPSLLGFHSSELPEVPIPTLRRREVHKLS